jgi:hypothetical protein
VKENFKLFQFKKKFKKMFKKDFKNKRITLLNDAIQSGGKGRGEMKEKFTQAIWCMHIYSTCGCAVGSPNSMSALSTIRSLLEESGALTSSTASYKLAPPPPPPLYKESWSIAEEEWSIERFVCCCCCLFEWLLERSLELVDMDRMYVCR